MPEMATRRVRAGVPALVLALALGLASCGADPSGEPRAGTTGSASPETSPAAADVPAGPGGADGGAGDGADAGGQAGDQAGDHAGDHAVEPPGPLQDRLWPADMLVVATEPLGEDVVTAIREVEGVEQVEVIGLAQAPVQDRVVSVAAVDPATYRRFTGVGTAQAQEVWDRVAAGEMAIEQSLGRRLADRSGYVRLGSSADAPSVHVGAYAAQVPQVQAVVNRSWEEALGMSFGNAVLISTGEWSPSVVRPRIKKVVGGNASVQSLDAVARFGLDPDVQQTAVFTGGSVADVVGQFNYQVLGGGRVLPDPAWTASHISTRTMPIIGPMTCNTAMFPQLEAALREIVDEGLSSTIHPDEYAGCYYPRFIANTSSLSNHSFGVAFDINVPGNQRGTVGEIDRRVVAIFERWGFTWGGRWRWTDPMHFEMNRVVEVG